MSGDSILKTSLAIILLGLAVSCASHDKPAIASTHAAELIPAIKSEVNAGHRGVIPYLVAGLENGDAAVRLCAIEGLQRLTGQDFGYEYYADEADRRPAVEQWKQWLSEHRGEFPPIGDESSHVQSGNRE